MTDRARVAAWIDAYERAWRTPGTDPLDRLFTADASYLQGPYLRAVVGLESIQQLWESERDGPDETFTMASEIVAVDGDVAVARVEVTYGDPVTQEYLDLWLMWFDADGRCRRFEEWPFWPESDPAAG
jgi:SnoaL-like domain